MAPSIPQLPRARSVPRTIRLRTLALVQDTKDRLRPGHLPAIFTDA